MRLLALALAWFVVGCSGAGPYGYSRTYTPLDEEEKALGNSKEFDPVMAQRVPDEWKKARVNLFGVVKARKDAAGGGAYLTLGMRTLGGTRSPPCTSWFAYAAATILASSACSLAHCCAWWGAWVMTSMRQTAARCC